MSQPSSVLVQDDPPAPFGASPAVYATRTVYDDLGRAIRTERLKNVVVSLDAAGKATLTSAGTICFRNELFGESVEGLSHFSDERGDVQPAVQNQRSAMAGFAAAHG